MEIKIMGVKEAEDYLKQLRAGAQIVGTTVARAGTNKVYAWGIEFGRRRNGKLARRAGGSFALTDAFKAVQPNIAREIRDALPLGPRRVLAVVKALAMDVVTGTKQRLTDTVYASPISFRGWSRTKKGRRGKGKPMWKRTGNLRRSYHTEITE